MYFSISTFFLSVVGRGTVSGPSVWPRLWCFWFVALYWAHFCSFVGMQRKFFMFFYCCALQSASHGN